MMKSKEIFSPRGKKFFHSIPFFRPEVEADKKIIENGINRIMKRGSYILGEEVKQFEKAFSAFAGVKACVGVGNGTDALELALRALYVSTGDYVALTANAGFYGTAAVRAVGAVPLYIDVDEHSHCLSVEDLEKLVSTGVQLKCIIVTHLYGKMADMKKICEISAEKSIPVIEDCAQAHGAVREGRSAGSWGKLGCFSFYPTKNLGCIGDGGAIVGNDKNLLERVRSLSQYGWSEKYRVRKKFGKNSRLDEIQASVLNEKLGELNKKNERRREIAEIYSSSLSNLPISFPKNFGSDYVAHLYVIQVENRKRLMKALLERGISSSVHFPIPDHKQEAYSSQFEGMSLVDTEKLARKVLSLPCFPGLSDSEVLFISGVVRSFFSQRSRSA